MDLTQFKTVEQLAASMKTLLSGLRNFSGLSVGSTGSAPVSGEIQATGDIYTVAWTDYFNSSSKTGWTSYTTSHLKYKKIGKFVFVNFFIEGTSDDTATSFTLPYSIGSGSYATVVAQIRDDDTFAVGVAQMSGASSTVTCLPAIGGGAWTSSGIKRVAGQFWYDAS